MAKRRIKKKQTKTAKLQLQYNKEYTNYLVRVRYQQKQGVQVKSIKKVKKPTQASIERLKKQTAKEIRARSSVVNMLTGELITPSAYGRKHALEVNRVFIKLTAQEQEYAREHGYTTQQELKVLKKQGIVVNTVTPVQDYEAIIDSWYNSLVSFAPKTAHYLRTKTDMLLVNATDKERALFAYTYGKSPDSFPTEVYMDTSKVDAVFSNILQQMGMFESTQEFQNFIDSQDIYIEDE